MQRVNSSLRGADIPDDPGFMYLHKMAKKTLCLFTFELGKESSNGKRERTCHSCVKCVRH